METLSISEARRLALARAGLLKPAWSGLPARASGRGKRARGRGKRAHEAAHAIIRRFGYLQLDTVSVAGARSHAIVLHSRIEGLDASLAEELLAPGEPLFEYWGHEASWIPLELYSAFEFRRREFRTHPWWGDLIGANPELARDLLRRIRDRGPLRALDLEGAKGSPGWWNLGEAKKMATALWSSGELAIRERKNFQRSYDLTERVIPEHLRRHPVSRPEALRLLLLRALAGHGWASTGTLTATWRLRNLRQEIATALQELTEAGRVIPCAVVDPEGKPIRGWVRTEDLELAARLRRVRPRRDLGVLLSPFDPILWDRARVGRLFGFDQVLEIFKPAAQRRYGYYCMPVLAGERLVARLDLKAERKAGLLRVVSCRLEETEGPAAAAAEDQEAVRTALDRYAMAVGLEPARKIPPFMR
ncbi:MAG: winged helix-turn-helix domain-containing protein [bacterium]|nr:winged helix-turn-helix domain-containing protein [bacterium]